MGRTDAWMSLIVAVDRIFASASVVPMALTSFGSAVLSVVKFVLAAL